MSFHNITKSKHDSSSLGQNTRTKLLPFPGVDFADDVPAPKPAKAIDLTGALHAANPAVSANDMVIRIYQGVLGYNADELREMLHVPDTETSLFNYLYVIARTYIVMACEMAAIEVQRPNRPLSIDEIYGIVDRVAGIAGNQAHMTAMILRIDIVTGEPR